MFKVYDNKSKKWMKGEFGFTSNGDLFEIKRTKFGNDKLKLLSDSKYVPFFDIGFRDKNETLIYEGDFCLINEEKNIIGVIGYSPENYTYYLFDDKNLEYYLLSNKFCKTISVIGHVMNDAAKYEDYVKDKDSSNNEKSNEYNVDTNDSSEDKELNDDSN